MNSASPPAGATVWTVGHSNHTLEVLLDLLARHRIELLVDLRSRPYSGYASQFDREALQAALPGRGMEYLYLGDCLGGQPEDRQFYDADGRVLYDQVAQSPAFRRGIDQLLGRLSTGRVAVLCSEEDPANCHRRRLVSRVLLERNVDVQHIRGDGRIQTEAQLAAEENFRKTRGQLSLFDWEPPDSWKSTQSVSPKKAPPSSSRF